MPRLNILTLVMAGGTGGRMQPLTKSRAKPVLPFGGAYRLIDFPLSNCVHSDLSDVWVVEQFQPHALNDHLSNGRPWDLDRTYGGLRIMPPYSGGSEGGWDRGNADAIYRNSRFIREFNPDLVLVVSSDHIYKLEYRDVIDAHQERRAAVTMVTTRVPQAHATRFGNVVANAEGNVTRFAYKPEQPVSDTVTTEVFVYDTRALLETIDELMAQQQAEQDERSDDAHANEPGLKDFGDGLLPALVEQGNAYNYQFEGYWRDVGTIGSYWLGHMNLLEAEPQIDLDEPGWPILTYGTQRLPARIEETARIAGSLISPGCMVRGHVERSVLCAGVVVEQGATVREAVILENCVIRAGATVERAIVDAGVTVGERARVGQPGAAQEEGQALDEQIAVVGRGVRLDADARIEAGARVEPAEQQG